MPVSYTHLEVTLQGYKSEIEIDSNLDMQISVLSHEGAIEINQLSATRCV